MRGVRALEPAGARHVGVHDECGDVVGRQLARPAGDLGEPEPVEREPRVPGLGPVAAQRVAVGGDRRAGAARCRARRPGGPRRGGCVISVPAGPSRRARRRRPGSGRSRRSCGRSATSGSPTGVIAFGDPDRRRARRGQRREVVLDGRDRRPRRIVVAGLRPAGELGARVVGLALVEPGREDRSGRRAPLRRRSRRRWSSRRRGSARVGRGGRVGRRSGSAGGSRRARRGTTRRRAPRRRRSRPAAPRRSRRTCRSGAGGGSWSTRARARGRRRGGRSARARTHRARSRTGGPASPARAP